MSLSAGMLDAMVASGCTAEQIVSVVKAAMAADAARLSEKREKDAERQRRHRMSRDVTPCHSDTCDNPLVPPSLSPEPPITPPYNPPSLSSFHSESENNTPPAKPARAKAVQASDDAMMAVFSPSLGTDLAAEVINHRKLKKAAQTVFACELLVKAFEATGDPPMAARMMIARNWTGFEARWYENERSRTHLGPQAGMAQQQPRRGSAAILDALNRITDHAADHQPGLERTPVRLSLG